MTDVVILPTEYKGITFRSRTEARWAALFENMGIVWDYEPQGHGLEGRGYLPDFSLPEMRLWFEVKPDETDGAEVSLFQALVDATGQPGIIAYGPPSPGREHLLYFAPFAEPAGPYHLAEDRRDDGYYWLASADHSFGIGGPGRSTNHDRLPAVSDRPIMRAFEGARAERFGQ
jgi:hypothetical protein